MAPLGRPVTDQFIVLGRGCGREMGDPGVDPADGVGYIGAIDWNPVTDEEIFGDILFDPFPELSLLLHAPPPVGDAPDLKR